MKFAPVPQNLLEWIALKAGIIPTPLAYSHFGFLISKFLLEAVDKGIFEAIGTNKITVQQIASATKTNVRALESLLAVLAAMSLIKTKNDLIFLTPKSKKWLLKDSPNSLYWFIMFDNRVCWKWMDYVGEFLQTGKGLQYHQTFNDDEWFYYQKAIEATGAITANEAIRKIPVPPHAAIMLDIGGAHGLYSVGLCKKHSRLSSIILDLPKAVDKAEPLLQKHNMGSKVIYRKGNVLTDDLGTEKFEVVIMASVAHHFTADENIAVAKKVFAALKPDGVFTILEVVRSAKIQHNGDMLSALGDMFFALSSTSGLWTLDEIKQWQTQAGFKAFKKSTFLSIPGYTAVSGKKE